MNVKRGLEAAVAGLLVLWSLSAAQAVEPEGKVHRGLEVRSPGKPSADVSLTAAVRPGPAGKPAVAVPLQVDLDFQVPPDAMALRVQVAAQDAFELVRGGDGHYELDGKSLRHSVVVLPGTEGRHYLGITVSVERRAGDTQMRAFAVPFVVGSTAAAPRAASKGRVAHNSDGEAVVITYSQ